MLSPLHTIRGNNASNVQVGKSHESWRNARQNPYYWHIGSPELSCLLADTVSGGFTSKATFGRGMMEQSEYIGAYVLSKERSCLFLIFVVSLIDLC